jgi:hypothetical protein
LPKKLQPIIARSGRWGRIKAEVVCAMTSKYVIALYELVQLRGEHAEVRRDVPARSLPRADGRAARQAAKRAGLHAPGARNRRPRGQRLSDCGVEIEPVRKNPKAPITAVTIAWWRKQGDEYWDTLRELRQP